MGCVVLAEARIGTSSNVAGTRSTDVKNHLASARDLANVTREEMLWYSSAATSNGFHHEHVKEISYARILVRHVCAPDDNEDRVFGPEHFIATIIDNAPIGHSEKRQKDCAHCLRGEIFVGRGSCA